MSRFIKLNHVTNTVITSSLEFQAVLIEADLMAGGGRVVVAVDECQVTWPKSSPMYWVFFLTGPIHLISNWSSPNTECDQVYNKYNTTKYLLG